ncbi:M23 family metallopeptidase [Paenibacillus nasutitermitis]|uniref:M23ase beta-sheet core domain-containing protein n=1 Tax=Paenibacillus nasutitermitis TaxID=1652958 RepID=A0A917DPM6_9BACL|nr:M23 family metallopeptidase [Paenibacillus nasutitermitis]GGD54627.1 hypothetical protein GCM10010911_10320 [Paenibacillus nasutitermitis]
MDTNNGIRQRRQERIRRIMEQEQNQKLGQTVIPVRSFKEKQPLSVKPLPDPHSEERKGKSDLHFQEQGPDPEQMWKAQANPWESVGWELAPKPHTKLRNVPANPGVDHPRKPFVIQGLFIQSAVAAAIFVIVFAMFRLDTPIAKRGQAMVTSALTEQIDFGQAASWYNRMFAGAPSFIPWFRDGHEGESRLAEGEVALAVVAPLPQGTIVRSFAETLSGVELAGSSAAPVLSAETGRVLLVSEEQDTGKTIVIQHATGRMTVYGRLGQVNVAVNDWVEAGQSLGELPAALEGGQSLLFFAVKEKGRYVDPADIIPFD